MKQRNGKIKRLLNKKVIAIATIIALVAGIAISTNAYVRQANQVAQLKELNDQLILEQRKQKKESDEAIAELKKLVANQEAQLNELASKSKTLEAQNAKIVKENEVLKSQNDGLERANKDLIKKYRELVTP